MRLCEGEGYHKARLVPAIKQLLFPYRSLSEQSSSAALAEEFCQSHPELRLGARCNVQIKTLIRYHVCASFSFLYFCPSHDFVDYGGQPLLVGDDRRSGNSERPRVVCITFFLPLRALTLRSSFSQAASGPSCNLRTSIGLVCVAGRGNRCSVP